MKTYGKQRLPDSLISPIQLEVEVSRPHRSQRFGAAAANEVHPTATLLLVDDDPAARQWTAEILSRESYKVLQAGSAEEALRVAQEVGVIHLLISDVSKAQIDAVELSHRFRKIHPQTPVLVISGSLRLLRDATRGLECVALLAKPFASDELLDKVRTLLNVAFLVRIRTPWAHD